MCLQKPLMSSALIAWVNLSNNYCKYIEIVDYVIESFCDDNDNEP